MGQKVHPKIFRTGILWSWDSKWFSLPRSFASVLREDLLIKKFLKKELKGAGLARTEIERTPHVTTIIIHSAKPGVIIGRQGVGIEDLKAKIIRTFFASVTMTLNITVVEVDRPALNAQLVAQNMIEELEKRMPYRRVLKQALDRVQKGGAQGVKVNVAGRLNGAEIANSETLSWGKIPLHTLRAHIDFARTVARTSAGAVGVKVWIYKGEEFKEKQQAARVLTPRS